MNKTENISETTSSEPACSLSANPEKIDTGSDQRQKCDGTCTLSSIAEHDSGEDRKPAKRNGCIGNWLERMAKVNRKTFGCSGLKCHCGG